MYEIKWINYNYQKYVIHWMSSVTISTVKSTIPNKPKIQIFHGNFLNFYIVKSKDCCKKNKVVAI